MKKIGAVYLIFTFIILYAPIFYLIFYSFNSGGTMHGFESFTLDWYKEMFQDTRLMIIVINTLIIGLLSALISTILGTAGALAIVYVKKRRTKNILFSLNNVLLVSPDVIIGASFLVLFTLLGVKLGFMSVLLSHIAFCVPIVVIMVLPRLEEMSWNLVDAAYDLGASRWETLSRVIIPLITPVMFSGFFMALTFSLDDFAVTFFVTGNGFSTLAVEIYSRARHGISLTINALSSVMFLVTVIIVLGSYFINQRRTRLNEVRAKR